MSIDTPPMNLEAEEAAIGGLLVDGEKIIEISQALNHDDFWNERHGMIYSVMLDLYEKALPLDMLIISDELERRGQLKEIGGADYLTKLASNGNFTSSHTKHYAEIVSRTAFLRRLINASGEIAQLAYQDSPETVQKVATRAQSILDTAISGAIRSSTKKLDELLSSEMERQMSMKGKDIISGVSTGLRDLDSVLGGLQNSDMIVMAGRPGMGKTSLALSIMLQAAQRLKKRVALFSLEMSDEQITQRLVSADAGINSRTLRLGQLNTKEQWEAFYRSINDLQDVPIFVNDQPALTVQELRLEAKRLHALFGLDMIMIDYLQLMSGQNKRNENRQQEISYISRTLKQLARELRLPIVALSQLSRAVEQRKDKRPILSDLRESGSIEQDADIVMFIYRDSEYYPNTKFPNIAEILVSKHRNGPTAVLQVYFRKHLAQFVDLEIRNPLM